MEHLMLIERHGSIVAGIGRVSALDHPGVRFATTADAPQRGGMSQQVFEPPLTQARMRWGGKAPDWGWARRSSCMLATKDTVRGGT